MNKIYKLKIILFMANWYLNNKMEYIYMIINKKMNNNNKTIIKKIDNY